MPIVLMEVCKKVLLEFNDSVTEDASHPLPQYLLSGIMELITISKI